GVNDLERVTQGQGRGPEVQVTAGVVGQPPYRQGLYLLQVHTLVLGLWPLVALAPLPLLPELGGLPGRIGDDGAKGAGRPFLGDSPCFAAVGHFFVPGFPCSPFSVLDVIVFPSLSEAVSSTVYVPGGKSNNSQLPVHITKPPSKVFLLPVVVFL